MAEGLVAVTLAADTTINGVVVPAGATVYLPVQATPTPGAAPGSFRDTVIKKGA